jgi:subtilisin family serine protease
VALGLLAAGALAGAVLVDLVRDRDEAPERRAAEPHRRAPLLPTRLVRPRYTPGPTSRVPSPRRGVGAGGDVQPTYVPGQLLVKFEEGTSAAVAGAVLDRAEADQEERVRRIDVRVVDVPPSETREALAELEASSVVEYVERDVAIEMLGTTPNDLLWSTQWGPVAIEAPAAWDVTKGAPDVVVAVLDTGIDHGHPDLAGSLVAGYDVVNGDSDAADDQGHGTASAGVIAARTNNGQGQAGMCWRCSLMPVKVLAGNGFGTTAALATGIIWAVDHGADVISMSVGGPVTTQTLTEALAYASRKGVVLVGAAGNSGSSTPNYPAADPQVLSVAGTTEADSLYSWSNFGSWVQVAAPGCNTAAHLGAAYVNFCGTSSATPVVAGLAGLLLSSNPTVGKAGVERAIRETAVRFSTAVQYGRIDAEKALESVASPPSPAAAPPSAEAAPLPSASPAAPPTPSPAPPADDVQTITGRFAGSTTTRRYTRTLETGRVTATLRATGERPVTLSIVGGGRTIARVSGRGSLRLSRRLNAGSYKFLVTGRSARFTLRLGLTPS